MRTPALLMVCVVALAACAQSDRGAGQGSTAAADDARLARDLVQASLAEIDTGKLAASKAQSEEVRSFAQHMVEEHSKMLKQGKEVAAAAGIKVPEAPGFDQQAAKTTLLITPAGRFDRAYIEQMVKDHTSTLALLNRTVAEAKDPQLKALARQAIPHVQQHLEMAKRLEAQTQTSGR